MIEPALIYALVVWAIPARVGDEPIFVDPRPMSYVECRHRRQNELTFYGMLRNTPVYVLCQREDGDE